MSPPILIITILTLVIFLISLLKTDFALIILILSMFFSPELRIGSIPGREVVLRVDDIFLGVVFLGWLAKMAINKELGLLRVTPLNRPILTYVSICVLTTLMAAARGDLKIQSGVFYLLKYLEYFLLFFMVVNQIKTLKQAKLFVFFLLATCFLVCLYSWINLGAAAERISAPFEGKEGGEPNTLAGYLILMMALILGFIIQAKSGQRRILFLCFLGLTFIPFVFTLSRGGWLAFFPMFLTLVIISKKYKTQMLLAFVGLIILLPLVAPERVRLRVKETFAPEKTYTILGKRLNVAESAAARIDSWQIGFQRWTIRPLFGFGIPAGTVIDNQYTRVLAETGILGLLAFLWIIKTLFSLAWRIYTIRQDEFSQALSMGFIAGLVGLLVQSCSAATFILIRIMEPFWFLAAIVAVWPEIINRDNPLD